MEEEHKAGNHRINLISPLLFHTKDGFVDAARSVRGAPRRRRAENEVIPSKDVKFQHFFISRGPVMCLMSDQSLAE